MLKLLLLCAVLSGSLASPRGPGRQRETAADEVCYDNYGCFSSSAPWTSALRPLSALPMRPEEVQTRHLLFTRNTREEPEELIPGKDPLLDFSQFDGKKKTAFIIHGWTDSLTTQWVQDTKDGLLDKEDLNVFVIDWSPGASKSYVKATGNARLVGAQIAKLIDYLTEKTDLTNDRIHLIGHSLGAHVAGYVGSRVPGIGRLTALDPTQPYFEGTDRMVRVDETDALFVEGIHTNGPGGLQLGLGMVAPVGNVDIYPNGGEKQPGCRDLLGNLVTSIIELITLDFQGAISAYACSHARAPEYWAESLKSQCPFVSYSCEDYKTFNKGSCFSNCQETGSCLVIGYENDRFAPGAPSGKYYLHTNDAASYCLQEVELGSNVGSEQSKVSNGKVTVTIRRADGSKSEKFELADGKIEAGSSLAAHIEIPSAFLPSRGEKVQAILHYSRGGLLPGTDPKTLVLNNLTLSFLAKDLSIETKSFGGVTLEAGTDLIVSEV